MDSKKINDKPRFYTVYRPAFDAGTVNGDPSETRAEFADECDINKLVARFENTGTFYNPLAMTQGTPEQPEFIDWTQVPDLMESNRIINDAKARFEALPARVRDTFNNSMDAFLAAFLSPETRPRVLELLGYGVQGSSTPATAKSEGSPVPVPAPVPAGSDSVAGAPALNANSPSPEGVA